MREMLILLHPIDATWDHCRAVLLDDSPRAFPYNSVQSLNISTYPVQILLNGTRFTLSLPKIRPLWSILRKGLYQLAYCGKDE